jgi:hypothetical protein
MRYDSFIIWGNGLDYIPYIVNMIREDFNFEIVTLKRFPTGDMESFIKRIYGCDPYPWEHLIAKTRYLLQSPQEIVFILVKNLNPQKIIKGKGAFEHVECTNVINLKIKIRNKFNPRWDSSRRIAPLNAGVSHNHCIHGSDYEAQTEYILKELGMPNLDYYRKNENKEYYFPYHIEYQQPTEIFKDIDDLKINIIGKGPVSITQTPHYQYAIGNKDEYTNYFYNNFGVKLCEDHFPEAFDNLINKFNVNYLRPDNKKTGIIVNSQNLILDGVHRLSIYKSLNHKQVKCLQIK